MADVINLRMARKARKRAGAAQAAAENRARHGADKAERAALRLDAARDAARIDGAKREAD